MPRGRYSLYDPYDNTPLAAEHFQCAPGPSGWRYNARTTTPSGDPAGAVDLTTDALSRPLRLELHAADWRVRGTCLDGVSWVRTGINGVEGKEGNALARAFTGSSPCFLVAVARLLRLAPGNQPVRVRLVCFTSPVLAPRTVDQLWTLRDTSTHATDSGPLVVENYQVSDASTGDQQLVHLAGDVVLAAAGVELEELEGPPSASMCTQPQ